MPKTFPISIQVEDAFVAKVMRQLHHMPGVADIKLEFGTPRHQRKSNGLDDTTQKKFADKAEDYIGELLNKSPMPTAVIRDHFADVGRSPGSVSSSLNLMLKAGEIKRAPDGKSWALTKKMKDRLRYRKAPKK